MNDDKRYRVDPELLGEGDMDVDLDLNDKVDAIEADDEGGAFHDPVLRRALAHAPDHAVLPMDETRESIVAFAHEAVAPSLDAAPAWAQRSFVQRVLGMRGGSGFGAHIPWNGLVAIALAGVAFVVQDPELMDDIQRKVTRKEAAAPAVANAPATVVSAAPVETPTAVAPVTPAIQLSAPPPTPVASTAPAPAVSSPLAVAPTDPETPTMATPPVESPADAAARAVLVQKLQRLEAAEAKARLSQHSDAGGLPSNLFSGALPRTAIPVEVPLASRTGKAGPTPAATATAAASPARVEDAPQPTFTALSQWTRLTITSSAGETRRIARADAGELGPLVGSTALSGVGPQPLSGRVEWRIAFERNGEQLGMLEVAGTQIRWKEKGFPAGTGAPPASGLASLLQALKEVHAEPVKSAEPATGAQPSPTPPPAAPPGAEPAQ